MLFQTTLASLTEGGAGLDWHPVTTANIATTIIKFFRICIDSLNPVFPAAWSEILEGFLKNILRIFEPLVNPSGVDAYTNQCAGDGKQFQLRDLRPTVLSGQLSHVLQQAARRGIVPALEIYPLVVIV